MIRYDLCNHCVIRNCKKKPHVRFRQIECQSFMPVRRGWKMLEAMVSKDPVGTAKFLHAFGMQLVSTKKGPKAVLKR